MSSYARLRACSYAGLAGLYFALFANTIPAPAIATPPRWAHGWAPHLNGWETEASAVHTLGLQDASQPNDSFRRWSNRQSMLQLGETELNNGSLITTNAHAKHVHVHPWQRSRSSTAAASAAFKAEQLVPLDEDVFFKTQKGDSKFSFYPKIEPEPSLVFLDKSITSTNTPSAFTLTDPFAEWLPPRPPQEPRKPSVSSEAANAEGTHAESTSAAASIPPQNASEAHKAYQPDGDQQSHSEAQKTYQPDGGETPPPTGAPQAGQASGGEQPPSEASTNKGEESAKTDGTAATDRFEDTVDGRLHTNTKAQDQTDNQPNDADKKGEEEKQENTSASSQSSKAEKQKVATRGGQTLEKALAQQVEKVKLTEQETKDFVDTKAVAKNVRRLVGLKAGSNLHLENEKLIKPGCDIATFGPAYCASEDNPRAADILWSLEHRKNNTYFVIAICMLAFAILVQCSCRVLEKKVIRGGDQFSREVMETAFRQIAYIAIVDVILWGCMQSNVAEILDEIIFGDVMPQHRDADIVLENVLPMLQVLFEELFFVAILLLIWYVVFVVFLQCLVRQLASWMRKVDEEEDVATIARKAEIAKHSTFGRYFQAEDIAKACFLAHRYEFADNVQTMSIPGIDPSGYYFMEYMRASLMQMAIKMLRLPNSTLVLLMIVAVILRPFLSFRVHPEAALLTICSFLCLLVMLITWAYVNCIERQLLPRRVAHYLVMRYHMEVGGDASSEYLEEYIPMYKLHKQKSAWPGVCSRYLYGTTLPNKHQQLFCFWANGPNIVMRALEATYFCQLVVLAWWIQLARSHPATWLRISWWGNIGVGVCAILHFALLKQVLYSTLIAVHSGMLIDHELLAKVWEIQRAESVRRTAELVDGLRVQSTLFAISEGGEMFWKQMQIKALSVSRSVKEQMVALWASLDEEHLGQIDRPKLFRFLKSQGLSLRTESDVNDFLQVFDRTNKGGVDEEEFYVLVIVVKQLLMEPLDKDALRALFEDKYGIPWSAPTGIDVNSLSRILAGLGLQWSEGKRRYLLDFVGGKRGTTGVSADLLVSQLQAMEEQTLQPLQQVVGEIQKRPQERGGDRV